MIEVITRYQHKIKTVSDLVDVLGRRPRKRSVILCHGVFDVVHPGHLRHLLYARDKADILIASVTADIHVDKGAHRPHVPQELRAANLAAFEMVDYVIIDTNSTPLWNIGVIQPDYFAKGFEYNGQSTKTAAEVEAVQSYGGEVIFTPGDVVYSSSKLIELAPPDIKYAKLGALMERSDVSFDTLRRALDDMCNRRVHVVGDTIVDTITHANVIGASGKTPTMSVQVERQEHFIGGAAIVAKHLRAAGAHVTFSTVIGDDQCGQFVVDNLSADGIDIYHTVDTTRPTTNKNAIVANGYRLLKLDTVNNHPISERAVNELRTNLSETPVDAVVFSDFRHGVFNRATIPALVSVLPACFTVADSQVASRWGNILDFKGFDLITPNEKEARFATADQDSGLRALAWSLYAAAKCRHLILKLGERGILVRAGEDSFALDSFVDRLVDPVGAGDALLAYSTLGMLTNQSPVVAAILGTFAAGIACERDGNVPVAVDDLRVKLDTVEGR